MLMGVARRSPALDWLLLRSHFTKIRLHESWEWTSGDKSKGQSIIEEI
tara:strand:+ start:72 stop:215 length:144 start_codon:yes stop_codon:yes gene_type:complete